MYFHCFCFISEEELWYLAFYGLSQCNVSYWLFHVQYNTISLYLFILFIYYFLLLFVYYWWQEIEERYRKELNGQKKKLKWYAENQQLLDKDVMTLQQKDNEIKELRTKLQELQLDVSLFWCSMAELFHEIHLLNEVLRT